MIVYKITNKVNNKVYIGITSRKNGFKGRYSSKGKGIERVYNFNLQCKERGDWYNIHLLRSIEKYGFDNFEVDEYFDRAETLEELKEKEVYWISYYKSDNPKYGYNNTKGGDGVDNNIISTIKKRRGLLKWHGIRNVGYCGSNRAKKKAVINQLCKNRKNTRVYICRMCGKLYVEEYGDIKKGFCDDCIEYEEYYDDIVNILGKLQQVEEYEKSHYKKSPRKYYSVPFVSSFKITKEYCETQQKSPPPSDKRIQREIEREMKMEMEEYIYEQISDEEEKELFRKSAGWICFTDEDMENMKKLNLSSDKYSEYLIKEYKKYYDKFVKKYWDKGEDEYEDDEFSI